MQINIVKILCAELNLVTTVSHIFVWSCSQIMSAKEAAASEAAGQTKEEFSGNDTSRHPKVLKVGPKLGCQ